MDKITRPASAQPAFSTRVSGNFHLQVEAGPATGALK